MAFFSIPIGKNINQRLAHVASGIQISRDRGKIVFRKADRSPDKNGQQKLLANTRMIFL